MDEKPIIRFQVWLTKVDGKHAVKVKYHDGTTETHTFMDITSKLHKIVKWEREEDREENADILEITIATLMRMEWDLRQNDE